MEETSSLKRQRDESTHVGENKQREEEEEEVSKRQKSYTDIMTLLEEEEDEPNEDLSSLISTLQEEISSSSNGPERVMSGPYEPDPENPSSGSGEEEGERVMRHLLEASDDELGLPNNSNLTDGYDGGVVVGGQVDGGDFFLPFGEGLWEFEDYEAANYYSLLQSSEIFM